MSPLSVIFHLLLINLWGSLSSPSPDVGPRCAWQQHGPAGSSLLGSASGSSLPHSRCTHTVTGTGVVHGLENVSSFLIRVPWSLLSEILQETALSKCFCPHGVCTAYCHQALSCCPYPACRVHLMRATQLIGLHRPAVPLFGSLSCSHKAGLKAEAWVSASCPEVKPD